MKAKNDKRNWAKCPTLDQMIDHLFISLAISALEKLAWV